MIRELVSKFIKYTHTYTYHICIIYLYRFLLIFIHFKEQNKFKIEY